MQGELDHRRRSYAAPELSPVVREGRNQDKLRQPALSVNCRVAEHGLTTADIDAHTGGKKRGPKPRIKAAAKSSASAAKYRDPKTGATWSGHGRAPGWIASAKDRSKLLVEGSAVSPALGAKKVAKAGNYVRGPQPALYRDPNSGATWSGRGRAPAWIAGAKDRSRFLIDGATAADKKPVVKKAAAKKVATANKGVAKKAATKRAVVKKAAGVKKAPVKTAAKSSVADIATTAQPAVPETQTTEA
ncbi:H-NS histone family protein [Paraburkholderia phenoliruptrix]|uniref:H-NS histone family protein n=1 Tax=Paraburkholderia phenoliruptrix TaxID=252970 RepID=UPI001C4EDCE3|nr:H-NS histone family protein [Paraburkholderia phenoliruptrix]MBW0446006.1 H-NS histone family protein [Paraburkholderia phenoliruptrix]MBW9100008.1 H-NS histone family protein [Paraburkholderia phenoliruptrix]